MVRMNSVLTSSLALIFVAGAAAPATANAWPMGKLFHLHPGAGQAKDARICVQVHNNGYLSQDVKVDGVIYSVPASQSIMIKAPAGTQIYSASVGPGHLRGDLLYTVRADQKNAAISFN